MIKAGRLNREGRYAYVDGMRAIAVLLVVAMHAGISKAPGDGGVTIFFVISGYIITTVLIAERERSGSFNALGFYWRRALKLGPPFLVAIAIPSIIYGFYHQLNWTALLGQAFFVFNWLQVFDPAVAAQVLPGSSVVWSLAVEEQFYICFAILWAGLVRLGNSLRIVFLFSIVVAIGSVLCRSVLATQGRPGIHVEHGTDARVEAIAYGVALAVLMSWYGKGGSRWLKRFANASWIVIAVLIFLASSIVFRDAWTEPVLRPTAQALAAVLALASGLLDEKWMTNSRVGLLIQSRQFQLIGLASYSIYLCHFTVAKALEILTQGSPMYLSVPVNIVAGVTVGVAMYLIVEKPAQRYRSLFGRDERGRRMGMGKS